MLDDVAKVEPVDVVGAHHKHDVRRGRRDLVTHPEQLVGVALGKAVLVEAAGALLGHEQPQPLLVAVEVPRASVGHLLLQGRALELHR